MRGSDFGIADDLCFGCCLSVLLKCQVYAQDKDLLGWLHLPSAENQYVEEAAQSGSLVYQGFDPVIDLASAGRHQKSLSVTNSRVQLTGVFWWISYSSVVS